MMTLKEDFSKLFALDFVGIDQALPVNIKLHFNGPLHITLYFVGGFDRALHMDRASVECYDSLSEEWTFVSEMEKARSGLALVAIEHFIYAFGGRYKDRDQYFDLSER